MNYHRSLRYITAVAVLVISSHVVLAAAPKKVAPDGRGDFATIQAAVDSVPIRNSEPVVIEIAPGRYREQITIPKNKPFITLRGMGNTPAEVWISSVIAQTGAILTVNGSDFVCEHVTLDDESVANDGQAHAAIAFGGLRQVVEDCDLRGRHNTVFVRTGTQAYVHFSSISGTGDIIYGSGTAYFDTCDIGITALAGTIATPSTPKDAPVGFVFVDCHLTGPGSARLALMRPWAADGATSFIRCSMNEHFAGRGWCPWEGRETTCRAEEFGSTTPDEKPLDISMRPLWVHRLSAEQATHYTLAEVYPGWTPHPHDSR